MSTSVISFPIVQSSTSKGKEKENIPLLQSTFDKQFTNKRKRTITLVNGDEIDINASVPAKPEIVEAMRLRIIELEDQLNTEPSTKRVKTSSSMSAPAVPAVVSAGSKADEKKRKQQLKKIYSSLQKECRSDTCKFQGGSKTIKIDEVLEKDEFDLLFSGKGLLIQPTPTNKPKSTVTIIQFYSRAHLTSLFGDELKPLKGNRWSVGGVPTRRMGGFGLFGGGGSTFSKSVKLGACEVAIRSLEVNFAKNSLKASLKFEVEEI